MTEREISFSTEQPDGQEVLDARLCAGLSQEAAAESVHLSGPFARHRWSEYERGVRRIDLARWELFLLKAGLHPDFYAPKQR